MDKNNFKWTDNEQLTNVIVDNLLYQNIEKKMKKMYQEKLVQEYGFKNIDK